MKTLKTILLLAVFSTATVSSVNAQGCCGGGGSSCSKKSSSASTANAGANGGTVKQVGKYKVEMVFNPLLKRDPINFYLTTKKGKPVSNQGITGKAELTYADGSTGTIILEPKGDNGFAGQITNKTQSFICLATFTINGENVTARFESGSNANTKENQTTQAIYTCPMHPEVQSDKQGSCPKCGMALEKK